MNLLTLLLFLLFPFYGVCSEFGYIKAEVLALNHQHTTPVQVKLNNNNALSFSHATSQPTVMGISKSFLANGKSTPMSSDYSRLQQGCRFSYRLSYSFDRQTWIDLGTYEAPTNSVQTSIPIGLCNGSICSRNSEIQSKIKAAEEAKWKAEGEQIRQWLETAVAKERARTKAVLDRLKEESRNAQKPPEAVQDLQKIEKNREIIKEAQPPTHDSVAMPAQTIDDVIAVAIENSQVNQLIEKNAREEEFLRACSKSDLTTQYMCERYGGLAWIGAAAETINIALAVDPQRAYADLKAKILNSASNDSLQTEIEKRAEMRLRIQKMVEAKRSEEKWNQIKSISRGAVAFSPLNDVVDFCEAFTGRTMCLTNGEPLSPGERLLAVAGLIAGNRLVWEKLTPEARISQISEFFNGMDPHELKNISLDFKNVNARNADEVNSQLAKLGYTFPPYKPGVSVLETVVETNVNGQFVRFVQDENSIARPFIIPKSAVEGMTPEQVAKELNLLAGPPKYIVDVDLPAGTTLRFGVMNPRDSAAANNTLSIQYEIAREKIPQGVNFEDFFTNFREFK